MSFFMSYQKEKRTERDNNIELFEEKIGVLNGLVGFIIGEGGESMTTMPAQEQCFPVGLGGGPGSSASSQASQLPQALALGHFHLQYQVQILTWVL